MKFNLSICFIFLLLFSCSETEEKEVSQEDRLKEIVENFMATNFKEYKVEKIELEIESISPKEKLEREVFALILEVNQLTKDGENIKFQREVKKKEIQTQKYIMSDDLYGQDEARKSLEQTETLLKKLKEETQIKLALAKEKQLRSYDADSTSLSYLDVKAKVSVSKKGEKQVVFSLPFYISEDYKILQGPEQLLNIKK
jgi:hypothetical protein